MKEIYKRQESLDLNTDIKVIVVGCGGVSWSFAKFMAMAGVDDMVIYDSDTVEIHNLSRLDCPFSCIGRNKADLLVDFIKQMRPDTNIKAFPFNFNPDTIDVDDYDYFIDGTDNFASQIENQRIAKENGCKYLKIGYNGSHITVATSIGEWDTDPDTDSDGYTVIPSYISPAAIVAGLAVDMILTENIKDISCNLKDLYITK